MGSLKHFIFPFILQLNLLFVQAQNTDLQNDVVIFHDSLTEGSMEEIHLSSLKGWKFSSKDHPTFSSITLDDGNWVRIDSSLNEPGRILDSLWKGFGWFRMKVKIDSSFHSAVTFQSYPGSGAVELYINDSLVLKRGTPASSSQHQILKPANFSVGEWYQFTPGATYQLAVKYSFHDFNKLGFFSPMNRKTDFGIHMFPPEKLELQIKEDNISQLTYDAAAVILFLVMSLHLLFYLKIRNDRKNFWIFLITMFIFLFALLIIINTLLDSNNYYLELGLLFITQVCFTLIVGFIPLVLHKVLEVPVARFWKIYTALPFVIFIAVSYAYSNDILMNVVENNLLPGLLIISSLIGGIVALVKAHKKKRQDMSIVAGSFLAFPILILVGLVAFDIFNISAFLFGALLVLSILIVIPAGLSLYQGKKFLRLHKRMDDMVEERTYELELAMENLRRSNENLKEAQEQLVQQEKLASLGQLTAGIAHEIKNPLNFVTNFSEVCLELIAEAKVELRALAAEAKSLVSGNGGESYLVRNVSELLGTVEENLQKINQHGNRADGIVKSMLLHSRGGSGKTQSVNFNNMVQEYVNLAYHGMRAGKNPINVNITFELDDRVENVSLIREDISRVILNLCNNAFDALREKLETTSFSPELKVQTGRKENMVQLVVADNGSGIPEEIRDKILQPFFTTKKGTEGTGLGLSITNDIIKAHGGKLEIDSSVGYGSRFIIQLPAIGLKEENLKSGS